MNAKQGFHWKIVENKPDNWEKLHTLIKSVNDTEQNLCHDKYWQKGDLIINLLIEMFPDLTSYLDVVKTTANSGKTSKKKEIMDRVEKNLIKKDLLNIRFDKNLRPLFTNFSIDITFDIMIFLWNFFLKQKVNISKIVLLDAVISLNRIMEADRQLLEDIPVLWQGMNQLKTEMNSMIDEEMYSLLFQNPIFLVESSANKKKKSVRLYPEQEKIIRDITTSIILNEPILMGNQMPTGTGKSFLCVPLAQKISSLKRNKTILFACSNELVNIDIASTALLGDDLHLWLSSLIRDDLGKTQVLLRPHKRCFPAKWKLVYKEESESKTGSIVEQWQFYTQKTGKNPDIVVADLEACYELLKSSAELGDPFIAYIDEFISDRQSNQIMAKICRHLPRHTILLSAILPKFDSMGELVSHFCEKYEASPDDCIYRVETCNVPITCAVIDQDGRLRMPHHMIHNQEDLRLLITEMRTNPRIRRCYTAKHVYYWSQDLQKILVQHDLDFMKLFDNIGRIQNNNVVNYAIQILEFLLDHFEYLDRFKEYKPIIMDPPDKNKVFKEQSHFYEGKTLFISNDTFRHLYEASEDLFDKQIKWSLIVDAIRRNRQAKEQKLTKLMNTKIGKGNSTGFTRLEKEKKLSEIAEMQTTEYLPSKFVINSKEHFYRFHPKEAPIQFAERLPIDLPDSFNESFTDMENLLFASGIGFYDKKEMTSHQRNLMMSIYRDLFFIDSCKDIVFGTNLPDLINVFITKDFALAESVPILYQLMGRVGRIGRSYHANIILDDEESVKKILSLDVNIDNQDVKLLMDDFARL